MLDVGEKLPYAVSGSLLVALMPVTVFDKRGTTACCPVAAPDPIGRVVQVARELYWRKLVAATVPVAAILHEAGRAVMVEG